MYVKNIKLVVRLRLCWKRKRGQCVPTRAWCRAVKWRVARRARTCGGAAAAAGARPSSTARTLRPRTTPHHHSSMRSTSVITNMRPNLLKCNTRIFYKGAILKPKLITIYYFFIVSECKIVCYVFTRKLLNRSLYEYVYTFGGIKSNITYIIFFNGKLKQGTN